MTRRRNGARSAWRGLCWAAGVVVACGREDPAAERAAQIDAGRGAYEIGCATCHEADSGVGPRLGARSLAAYGTAARLFNYVRVAMPYGAAGTLSEEAYWSVVAYLAASRDVATWEGALDGGREVGLSAGVSTP